MGRSARVEVDASSARHFARVLEHLESGSLEPVLEALDQLHEAMM